EPLTLHSSVKTKSPPLPIAVTAADQCFNSSTKQARLSAVLFGTAQAPVARITSVTLTESRVTWGPGSTTVPNENFSEKGKPNANIICPVMCRRIPGEVLAP